MKVTPAARSSGTGARKGEYFAGSLKARPGACLVEGMAVIVVQTWVRTADRDDKCRYPCGPSLLSLLGVTLGLFSSTWEKGNCTLSDQLPDTF